MCLLLPTPMARVLIAGPRSQQRKAVDVLYGQRALHIQDYTPPEGEQMFKLGTPLEGAERASGLLIKLRSFKTALGLEGAPPPEALPRAADVLPKVEASVVALEMSIISAADDKAKLEIEINDLKARIEELRPFEHLPVPLGLLAGYGSISVFTGRVRPGFVGPLQAVVKHLDTIMGEDPEDVVAVFVDTPSRDAAVKVLLDNGFQEVRVPSGQLPAFEEMQAAETLLTNSFTPQLEAKSKELDDLREKHSSFILAAAELLEMEVERCEAPLRGAQSPNTFVLEGYLPSTRVSDVRRALEQALGGKLHFEAEDVPQLAPPTPHGHGKAEAAAKPGEAKGAPSADANVPVALKNPRAAGAFEYLVRLISLPKYNEIDPTMLMMFVFPIFFGMMLGDIGYGLAVCYLGHLATRSPNADLQVVGKLLRVGGFMSFLFGFLYGELFGFEVLGSGPTFFSLWPHDLYVPWAVGFLGFDGYLPVKRLEAVPFLLSVSMWIGVVHVLFGMSLGFRNQLRAHGFSHALFAKGSWIILLVSGVIWMRALTGVMFAGGELGSVSNEPQFIVGIGIFLVGLVMLIKGEGAIGAIELPTLLGNVLSYARLLAVGLSGVAIALTANLPLIWALTDGSIVAVAVGIPLAVTGHLLGVFLGILGPGLHATRLHYVEFFTKFYQGGGRAFAPLGKEAKYVAL